MSLGFRLSCLILVASFDYMIDECNETTVYSFMSVEEQIEHISNVAKKYAHQHESFENFDPWVYVAGYSFSKELFWNQTNDTLDEISVCLFFITYGYHNGFQRNFLGPVCSREIAEKILYNTIKICIVGNCNFDDGVRNEINTHDIVIRCNRADNFNSSVDKVDYLVYRTVVFDQSPKFKNKMKNAIAFSKVIVEIDGLIESPSEKLKLRLNKSQVYYPLIIEKLVKEYHYKKRKTHMKKPSTGFCALQMILQLCALANINLYGFTFNGTYHHNWKYEKSFCDKHERVFIK